MLIHLRLWPQTPCPIPCGPASIDRVATILSRSIDQRRNSIRSPQCLPRPEGEASIVVSGLNSVFDQLIEAGLLQPDQLMPIRMGLGMGFVATGEDELTSEVEVRSNGGVYVNGQRMR